MKYLQVSFVLAWVVVLLLLSMLSFLLEYPLLVSRKRLNLHVQYVLTLLNLVGTWPNPNLFMRQTKLGKLSSWKVWRLSQLSLYEWVWINQNVLLSICFRWIEYWSCHETWEIFNKWKKNIIQDRKCLQTYTLLWNRSLGKLPNGNKKNLFSHKLTLFNQLYLIFTTISTAIIIRSSIIIIKHILVHKLRCVKVVINF